MKKIDKLAFAMAASLIFWGAASSMESFARHCAEVRGDTLRLHVVAHSNSEQDQKNKLAVRDALLERYSRVLSAGGDLQSARRMTEFLLDEIAVTAQKTLQSAGDAHPVSAEVKTMYFDTRVYDDEVTLPAGEYTALRVVIGEGAGENWWCVMYPPLCIPAASEGAAQKAEERIRSLSQTPAYEAKFAVVELAERLRQAIDGENE